MTRQRIQFDCDGASLDVVVDGADADPAIVLLPSSQRDSLDFDALAVLLAAARLRVLRPQPRGMGRSSPPPADLTLSRLAADVAAVIDAFGSGRAIVAGHAYGHYIARVTDLEHPQRVRGVVLLAAAQHAAAPELSAHLDRAADPAQPREQRLASLRTAFFAPGHDPEQWLEGWYPRWRDVYRRAAQSPPKDAWWPVSHAPVLDLQAARDPWRPPATRDELQRALGRRVSLALIADASHALIPEQPAAIAQALLDWIATLPR